MLVGACVAGACDVGDGVGDGVTVGTGVAVGSGAAVGASVGVGVGVSPGAWVAAGGDPAVGSGVAAGVAVAVVAVVAVVATAGEVCSPPQAARTVRTARHMRISVGTGMVPGNLGCLRAMAAIVRLALRDVNEAPAACTLSRWSTRFDCQQLAGGACSVLRVTSSGQKTGCANRVFSVERSFLVCGSVLRALGCRDFPTPQPRQKLTLTTPRACPKPTACFVVVILGKCPEKCRSNAPSLAATTSGR